MSLKSLLQTVSFVAPDGVPEDADEDAQPQQVHLIYWCVFGLYSRLGNSEMKPPTLNCLFCTANDVGSYHELMPLSLTNMVLVEHVQGACMLHCEGLECL